MLLVPHTGYASSLIFLFSFELNWGYSQGSICGIRFLVRRSNCIWSPNTSYDSHQKRLQVDVHAPAHHQTNDGIHTTVKVHHSLANVVVNRKKIVPVLIENNIQTHAKLQGIWYDERKACHDCYFCKDVDVVPATRHCMLSKSSSAQHDYGMVTAKGITTSNHTRRLSTVRISENLRKVQ